MIDGVLHRALVFWVASVVALVTPVGPVLAPLVLAVGTLWIVVYIFVRLTPPDAPADRVEPSTGGGGTELGLSRDR